MEKSEQKRYPWEKWLKKKQKFTLVQGKDFDCQVHGMVQQIRSKCRKSDPPVSVSVKVKDSEIQVKFSKK